MPRGTYFWPHFMGTAVGQVAALSITAVLGETSSCEVEVNENALRPDPCGDIITVKNGRVNLPSEPGLVVPPSSWPARNTHGQSGLPGQWLELFRADCRTLKK